LEDEANGGGQAEAFRLPGKTKRGYMGRHSSHALSSFVGTPKDKALSSYVSDRYLHGCSANSAHQFVPLSRRYLLLSRHKAQRNKTFEVYGTRLSHSGSFGSRKWRATFNIFLYFWSEAFIRVDLVARSMFGARKVLFIGPVEIGGVILILSRGWVVEAASSLIHHHRPGHNHPRLSPLHFARPSA